MGKKVTVMVPKEIKYVNDDYQTRTIPVGLQEIDEDVLDHPHIKNHGLKPYDPKAEAKAAEQLAKLEEARAELAEAERGGDEAKIKAAKAK